MCFIGNFRAYQDLKTWLQREDFPTRLGPSSLLCIVGPPGIGKTWGVQNACDELQLVLRKLGTNEVSNFKEFHDMFHKMCASDITAQFRCIRKDSVVFLIDELEAFLALDRTFLSSFNKMMEANTLPHARVILTTNSLDAKKELACARIDMYPPSESDIMLFLRSRFPGTSIETCMRIADACNGNLSYAIQMISTFRELQENTTQSQLVMDRDWNLGDIFMTPHVEVIRKVFAEDTWIMPLRFHENMLSEWKQRKGAGAMKRTTYAELLKYMCIWDLMMSYTKGEISEYATEILAHAVPMISCLERKANAPPPLDDFTRVFSHLSLEKKNMLALDNAEYMTDGLHSFHRHLYDSLQTKRRKK